VEDKDGGCRMQDAGCRMMEECLQTVNCQMQEETSRVKVLDRRGINEGGARSELNYG
jgi:hypothetical protein